MTTAPQLEFNTVRTIIEASLLANERSGVRGVCCEATMVSSSYACCYVLCFASVLILSTADTSKSAVAVTAPQIDEQLYSRQIFVYGKSAQQSLSSSHVLVKGSNKPLAAEIVKNLALAGVGKLTIVDDPTEKTSSPSQLLCGGESLAEYARSLNPLVSVSWS